MLADYLLAQFGVVAARHLFHWRALAKMEIKSITAFPLAVNIDHVRLVAPIVNVQNYSVFILSTAEWEFMPSG